MPNSRRNQSTGRYNSCGNTNRNSTERVSTVGSVRPLQHQNLNQAKADSELINRFERTHGAELQMALPKKPPLNNKPLRQQNSQRMSIASNQGNVWENLFERTQENGHAVKRGEYTLSKERQEENLNSYRTLNPNLQEVTKLNAGKTVTGCARQHISKNYQTNFNISQQVPSRLPPRQPLTQKQQIPQKQQSQSSFIIGTNQNIIIRDKALTSNQRSTSQVMKEMRDMRSSIDCLPGAGSVTTRNHKDFNKENLNPSVSRGLATSYQLDDMGYSKPEKSRAAKTYDRSMKIIEPKTYHS